MTDPPDHELAVFSAARRLSGTERAAFLDESCAGDAALRKHVEELLRASEEAGAFLERSAQVPPGPGGTIRLELSPTEKPGDRIGRYKLLQQIGEGGCGVVYMAEQTEPVHRRVALKVIKLGMDTKQVIARFEAERQSVALMDHPNIAKMLDAGATDTGWPYFVMELVRGIKITDYCDQSNLSTRERLDLFIQVCLAIQHAHQKGVIHRDIKPSNILVTVNDGVPVPKVIDFGIAKATQGRLTDKTLFTAFEQFIGTPAYMSPEQAVMTSLDIDTRSDIYSLGVLLYELLTGKTPFDAKALLQAGLDAMRRTIGEVEPPKPSARLSTMLDAERATTASHRQTDAPKLIHLVRGDLDWIVMKCLEKDRGRRYETANGLAMDVQHHLKDEPVVARPPGNLYKFQRLVRRNKGTFAAGIAIAAVLLIGVVVSTTEAIRATRAKLEQIGLRQQAEQAGDRAQRDEQLARISADEARHGFYAAQINLANRAWEAGELARALDLLETLRPRPDQDDLRGFEWFYLWGLCNGGLLHTIRAHTDMVWSIAFSPDGTTLASGSGDGTIGLWDTASGRQRLRLKPEPYAVVSAVAFTPDGKTLVSGGWDGLIRLWDADTGQLRATLSGQRGWIRALAVSSDGNTVASAGDAGEIIIWDLLGKQQRASFSGRRGTVMSLAFSPDNTALASGVGWGIDGGGIDLWNLKTGNLGFGVKIPQGAVSVTFSPDGKTLASARWSEIQLRDSAIGQLVNTLKVQNGNVLAVAFVPDGKTLLSCGDDRTIRMWQLPSNETNSITSRVIGAHLDSVLCLAVSHDGTMAASGANDGSIKLWNIAAVQRHESPTTAAGFQTWPDASRGTDIASVLPLPDNHSVLLVTSYGTEMRDLTSGKIQAAWSDATGRGVISPDGKLLATGTLEGKVKLWDAANGRQLASVQAHPSGDSGLCVALAFSPDGRILATGGPNGYDFIKFWDPAASLKLIREIPTPPSAGISAIAFSPDGKMLAAALLHQRVLLMNSDGQAQRLLILGGGPILATVFSPDGKLLATARGGGVISLWDVQTGRLRANLKGHASTVNTLAFSPDGGTLASGSEDHTVRLWDVATGQERIVFTATTDAAGLAFSLDGGTLIVEDQKGVVSIRRGIRVPDAEVEITMEEAGQTIAIEDYNGMAWTLATDPDPKLRDGPRAVDFAEKAVAATHREDPITLNTLAAAYAELGQFTNAVHCEQEAIGLLKTGPEKKDYVSRLNLYLANKSYREKKNLSYFGIQP
jgi:eukaryotic-like serine/threonine-protein kinase